jgi:hypothetical protein
MKKPWLTPDIARHMYNPEDCECPAHVAARTSQPPTDYDRWLDAIDATPVLTYQQILPDFPAPNGQLRMETM